MVSLRNSVLLAAAAVPATATEHQANPIRKVVTMLQSMQVKVGKEGEQEEELYKKFMCYCKTGGQDLDSSITAATEKIASVTSSLESTKARLSQAKDTLKKAQSDRSAAKTAMADATSLREKEAATYAQYKADADMNAVAISKAVAALKKGMAGGFLQSPAGATLRKSVPTFHMNDADRQTLVAFLSQGTDYAPQSGEITGILMTIGDEMAADLSATTATEEEAIKTYDGLMAAKGKEVAADTATIETKSGLIGELSISVVNQENDLEDTEASLSDDQKFQAELKKGCETKTAEWEERSKIRADELVALADTIKVLNDDDALELFKKTLPSASSLVQVEVSQASMRDRVLATLRTAKESANKEDRAGLQLLTLALSGKSGGGFGKIVKMIDNMVVELKTEQTDDDDKKEYCNVQFDQSDDQKKALQRTINNEDKAIATTEEGIATLTDEIAALTAGIKALDKSVGEATEQRKEENTEFKALMVADGAAQDVLRFAKNRLNKFYNPKLYKAPPKVELSREDRIFVSNGNPNDLVTTPPPGGITDTGIMAFVQESARKAAPVAPPATWDAYASKGKENNGVIAMIDLLIADLAKDMTTAEADEKNAQAEYEVLTADAADKRRTDSKALTDKTSAKADAEGDLEAHNEAHATASKELMIKDKYILSLHADCDWLMKYYDARKDARSSEIDSLGKAKAVLNGADYSLVQKSRHAFLKRA